MKSPLKKLFCAFALAGTVSAYASSSSFNLVVLPDTQSYAEEFPEVFEQQFQWISDNGSTITFAIQNGDITDNNNDPQWEVARKAFSLLDNKVPLTFVGGNHDLGVNGKARDRDSSLMNKYLPYEKYSKHPHFGGAFEVGKMDNTYHTFEAGGKKWLILSLEFGPRHKVIDWASQIIHDHKDHLIIINTHTYLYNDNTWIASHHKYCPKSYGLGAATGEDSTNNGDDLWYKLVRKHKNILMVLCGHVIGSGTGTLVSEGEHGNKVYQMLANYQNGVVDTVKGGNGYMRILNIDPEAKKIRVKTWSPVTQTYKSTPDQEFEFDEVDFQ